MDDILLHIIEKIELLNPLHGKKLKENIARCDAAYFEQAHAFLSRYITYLNTFDRDLDYGIECYLRFVSDMIYEQVQFIRTGRYSCQSFAEVYQRVYNNPAVMEYHLHGLLLSQFLWLHHYRMFSFFAERLPQYKANIKHYLEVGGGHGLFLSEAVKILNGDVHIVMLDVSPTSITMAKNLINSDRVEYILQDIFSYKTDKPYDFIVMGEVLEHVEHPEALLSAVRNLMCDQGIVFITVPANAPAIDHIYLFNNVQEIRDIIKKAGFEIVSETSAYAENLQMEKAEKLKVPLMYGAFLKKKKQALII